MSPHGRGLSSAQMPEDAIEYRHDKEEAEKSGSWFKRDLGMENMLKVLNKEMPIHVHAHRPMTSARPSALPRSMTWTWSWSTAPTDRHRGLSGQVPLSGDRRPRYDPPPKHETWNKTYETAGVLSRAGLKLFALPLTMITTPLPSPPRPRPPPSGRAGRGGGGVKGGHHQSGRGAGHR